MSKLHLDALIVVEGAMDKALLTNFLDAEIVTTNGSDVPRGTIDYIKENSLIRDVIVLTDPDSPGKRIRDVLDKEINGLLHAYVPKEKCIKGHKVGIAESNQKAILEALSHLTPSKKTKLGELTYSDLYELGLVGSNESSKLRNKVSHAFHLGECNGKAFLQRANALGLSKQQLKEAIHG